MLLRRMSQHRDGLSCSVEGVVAAETLGVVAENGSATGVEPVRLGARADEPR